MIVRLEGSVAVAVGFVVAVAVYLVLNCSRCVCEVFFYFHIAFCFYSLLFHTPAISYLLGTWNTGNRVAFLRQYFILVSYQLDFSTCVCISTGDVDIIMKHDKKRGRRRRRKIHTCSDMWKKDQEWQKATVFV